MRLFVTLVCTLFACQIAISQSSEIGGFLGTASYQGDLAPSVSVFSLSRAHVAGGIFYRFNFHPNFSARVNAFYGRISGDDAKSKDESRKRRNLSFESHVMEVGLTAEWNILPYEPDSYRDLFTPYIYAGITVFHFNPKAEYNGTLHELQPLGTEGQGVYGYKEKYNLTQIAIPLGIGFRIACNERLSIGIEAGARKTFTDYLDDVSHTYGAYDEVLANHGQTAANLSDRRNEIDGGESIPPVRESRKVQRGNLLKADWYMMGGVTVAYTMYRGLRYNRRGNKLIRSRLFSY